MIILVLIAAIVFYGVLYFLYAATQSHITTVDGWLRVFHSMIFLPEYTIFALLRALILIVLVYVVADSIFSGAKGIRRRRRERKQQAQDELRLTTRTIKPDA